MIGPQECGKRIFEVMDDASTVEKRRDEIGNLVKGMLGSAAGRDR